MNKAVKQEMKCEYCKEKITILREVGMRINDDVFCSWNCLELFQEQKKIIIEQDILKDRYSEGEIDIKGKIIKK